MLDFIKRLLTPLWYKEYLDTEIPVETTSLTDSDGNVVITKVDNKPIDPPTDENAVIDNIMWDGLDDTEHMDLEEFLEDLNKNAEMSLKQKEQMGKYVSETAKTLPPKKGKRGKRRRNLRYNLRNDEK